LIASIPSAPERKIPMLPPYIVNAFNLVPPNSEEDEYSGAWNSVLNYYFPISEGYIIAPRKPVGPITSRGKDEITFVVMKNQIAILFVEVKALKYLSRIYERWEADTQMRKRFYQLYTGTDFGAPPSVLYGVCAFGTRLSIYHYDKATNKIFPPRPLGVETSQDEIVDVAPADMWDVDLLSHDEVFQEVVNFVRELVKLEGAHIPESYFHPWHSQVGRTSRIYLKPWHLPVVSKRESW